MTLSVQHLGFSYPRSTPLLQDISLDFTPRTLTVFMGANGSGKSTLLRLLAGILAPSQGTILLNQTPFGQISAQTRARKIGILLQNPPPPFEISVQDFIRIGRTPKLPRLTTPTKEDETAIASALEMMKLTPFSHRSITELSGGEYQRARLAALLALESDILLLDEPANSLDPGYSQLLGETLQSLCSQGKTVIAVSHQPDWTEAYGNRLILLRQGQILADGLPGEILTPENLRLLF